LFATALKLALGSQQSLLLNSKLARTWKW